MAYFSYQGRNARGELVKGVLEGGDSGAVADQLFNTGITPISIDESTATGGDTAKESFLSRLLEAKISLMDLILFARQSHTLLKSGVPIIRAFAGLQESTPSPAMARVLRDLRDNLEAGRELSVSMGRHPQVFSPLFVALVRVGEMTGKLEEVFFRLFSYYGFEQRIRERIKAALRYPTFVMIAITIAFVVLNIFVIPVFAKLFSSFNAQLPLATRMLLGTSDFFVNYWLVMLIGGAIAAVLVKIYVGTDNGRYAWDRFKLKIPIAGQIIYKATLARFARAFSLSGKSGVPIVQALSVVSQVVDNAYIEQRMVQMRDGIERGESILRTAAASGIFNPIVLQMIAVGEETGEVDTLMQEIAEMYEREVEYEIEGLAAAIEPILLVFIGAMVLVLALGIFLPMWDMANAMRGRR
jgi:MSHA biogenesis protein MshG